VHSEIFSKIEVFCLYQTKLKIRAAPFHRKVELLSSYNRKDFRQSCLI